MSWKHVLDRLKAPGFPRRPLSIALRMTLWYALSAFALVFVTTGLLYWVLVNSLDQEDLRDLADNLNNARLLLISSPGEQVPGFTDQRPAWAPQQQPEIYLRVLDVDGRVITETPGMSGELTAPGRAELAQTSNSEAGDGHNVFSNSGKPFLTLIVRVASANTNAPPRYMQVAMDRDHDDYLLAQYRRRLWLMLGLSLTLCCLGGYLIARAGMRPIESISQSAARIRSTTLHERIDTNGLPSELRELGNTFNGMLDRLEQAFQHISQFSDNVAHELRTPINNLRGEIEVALGRGRSEADYRDILGSCLEECARISRLIQTLLFLARADTAADVLQLEEVDVAKELTTIESYYEAAAAESGVTLCVTGSDGLHTQLDRTLFQQAVGNLVSNAIAHSHSGSAVHLAATADHEKLSISVRDTGCGIAPEHLPHVFERFYRVDRNRAKSSQNLGLGLAVVKSIATRHGGSVDITSAVGRGTDVRLVIPLRRRSYAAAAE